jgi:hypothetical protein
VSRRQLAVFGSVSVATTSVYLLAIGVATAVIPNPLFERMTPVTPSNAFFWVVSALLFGPLLASYLVPIASAQCDVTNRTLAGGVLSFLAVGLRLGRLVALPG